ncbi:MAG: hypothetical protein ACLQIQ_21440 [Beijerinckiaceae bacterium]
MANSMRGRVMLPRCLQDGLGEAERSRHVDGQPSGVSIVRAKGRSGFAAVAEAKGGPASVTFKGSVEQTDIDPLDSHRASASGGGGMAGFAKRAQGLR